MVLPNIEMNLPQVYMCSPSWTLLPPPTPSQPTGSSQCTSPQKSLMGWLDSSAFIYSSLISWQLHVPLWEHQNRLRPLLQQPLDGAFLCFWGSKEREAQTENRAAVPTLPAALMDSVGRRTAASVCGDSSSPESYHHRVARIQEQAPTLRQRTRVDTGSVSSLKGSSNKHGSPLQYSCLENPTDRGAWCITVHRVAKSLTQTEVTEKAVQYYTPSAFESCPFQFHLTHTHTNQVFLKYNKITSFNLRLFSLIWSSTEVKFIYIH